MSTVFTTKGKFVHRGRTVYVFTYSGGGSSFYIRILYSLPKCVHFVLYCHIPHGNCKNALCTTPDDTTKPTKPRNAFTLLGHKKRASYNKRKRSFVKHHLREQREKDGEHATLCETLQRNFTPRETPRVHNMHLNTKMCTDTEAAKPCWGVVRACHFAEHEQLLLLLLYHVTVLNSHPLTNTTDESVPQVVGCTHPHTERKLSAGACCLTVGGSGGLSGWLSVCLGRSRVRL